MLLLLLNHVVKSCCVGVLLKTDVYLITTLVNKTHNFTLQAGVQNFALKDREVIQTSVVVFVHIHTKLYRVFLIYILKVLMFNK